MKQKSAQGEFSVDSPLPNQNIVVVGNECRIDVLPLHHGKETHLIRLRDISPFHAPYGHT